MENIAVIIMAAIAITKLKMSDYWSGIVGRNGRGSTWVEGLDLEEIFKNAIELPKGLPGMLDICRYFKLENKGSVIGYEKIKVVGQDKFDGPVLIRTGKHGPEFVYKCEVPQVPVCDGVMILGPGEDGLENEIVVWTAYPGRLTARFDVKVAEGLLKEFGENGVVPLDAIEGATVKLVAH